MNSENNEVYRTGQGVPVNGEYTCQSGERLKLKSDEDFPVCPISGRETTWARQRENE